jgi:hypothetical protein
VLYDQYNNAGPNHTRSTTFTDLPTFSIDLADDFVVPAGQTWNVQSIDADGTYAFGPGPATDWNVFIYTDSGGLPGTQVFSATHQPVVVVGTTFTVNLPVAAVLSAGTYWVEIQANMTFTPQGEWEWTDRMLQSNSGAALRNPGGDVGCGTDWIRKIFCVASMDPDQVFRLNGTIGGGTPTPTPTQCSWSAGPDLPSVGTRFVGVFFPASGFDGNNRFYVMGGRSSDSIQGSEFTHPFEYDPVSNTWTTKAATYPDGMVNNMACAVLNDSGRNYIYCVGGSQVVTNLVTGRVFRYDPINDTLTTVAAPWPPGVNTLPGGFAVVFPANKLYILGGFDNPPTGNSTNQIWEFTPNPPGWVQKNSLLPVPRSYIPTASIFSPSEGHGLIYTAGGSNIVNGNLTDTTDSFVYNPGTDSISTIASIPRATSNTRGLNMCNQMWVLGGGFPTPSNEVDIYDPASNTWSIGSPMPDARRNFATDTDSENPVGTNRIWMAGGYDGAGAIAASMFNFNCSVSPCAAPTPTPTTTPPPSPTATATPTATVTPTSTPVQITLHARGYKVHGLQTVDLFWSGPTSGNIDIYRDGVLIATVPNQGGSYTDHLNRNGRGTYTYRVCQAGTGNCSNQVTVKFGGGG